MFATVTFILIILSTIYTSLIYKYKSQAIELQDLKEVYEMEGEEKIQKLYYELELKRNLLSGQGTKEDPYKIYTIEDLVKFSNRTNAGDTFEGQYVELMETLDFNEDSSYENPNRIDYGDVNEDGVIDTLKTELTTGKGFPCISSKSENAFSGTFSGNENEIRNLYISNKIAEKYIGLFGYLNKSTVKDLIMTGNISNSASGGIGGIGGFIIQKGKCNIVNCINKIEISSTNAAGSVGGLIGAVYGSLDILDSHNEGNMSGSNNTGGLVGCSNRYSNTVKIQNSYNIGKIINSLGSCAGGLIGRDGANGASIIITDSYNDGEVEGRRCVGGILGLSFGTTEIVNTNNQGNVTSIITNVNSTVPVNGVQFSANVGGIIGISLKNANVSNCHNTGDITSNATYANNTICNGGVIGRISDGIVQQCHNDGKITGGNRTGGLLGGTSGTDEKLANTKVINSYNKGDVDATLIDSEHASHENFYGAAGGIAQQSWYGKLDIINSYNIGNVNAYHLSVGIVIGNYSEVNIINCYNAGNITTVSSYASGISKYNNQNTVKTINTFFLDNVSTGVLWVNPEPSTKMSQSEMTAPTFAETLNNNQNSINLSDYGLQDYKLSKWKAITGSYPEFE